MSYKVNFTDLDKPAIEVFDNTSNTETSLTFPGRKVVGYGKFIAENFLHLIENFASEIEPVNPVEGQLWYNTEQGTLQLWDNTNWKSASNIQKSPTEPKVSNLNIGELWIDTTNQQLKIFTGSQWVLVGPQESFIGGLRFGPVVEQIIDTTNFKQNVLTFYIADVPVVIVSKNSFVPKISISGFITIRSGINVNTPKEEEISKFVGGFLPKLYGIATSADSLNIGDMNVPAGRFFRTDTSNTTNFGINVKSSRGITLGIDSSFIISNTENSARIYNSVQGSSLDLQTNIQGISNTVVRIVNNRVGINNLFPKESLDVDGNISLTGSVIIKNNAGSLNLENGSFITNGGAAIGKNLRIGTDLLVNGTSQLSNIKPKTSVTYDLGASDKQWKIVWAKEIRADKLIGVLDGNIAGNAATASSLKTPTSFQLIGDVVSESINFDGSQNNIIFDTVLTADIISSKNEPFPNVSRRNDFVLTFRPNAGLLKQSRDTFISDLGVPIGSILPYAGNRPPYGYLLCDGSEVERLRYPQLFSVLGTSFNGTKKLLGINTFRLPDLRGRFPLGNDTMDNDSTVPSESGFIDAGGGQAGRVPDIRANVQGGEAGQSSVEITLGNLPQHKHNLKDDNDFQYSVIRRDTAINLPAETGPGPTAPDQAQYLTTTGGIDAAPGTKFNVPLGIMNPFQTVTYIIRSGPPVF